MTTKNIVIVFALLVLAACIVGIVKESNQTVSIPVVPSTVTTMPTEYCYYQSTKTASGLYDKAYLRLDIDTGTVTGEFNNYPAEKDSKTGTFNGTTQTIDGGTQIANVIWNTLGEGIQAKEELAVVFDDKQAAAAFGEMVQGANGVYVYKDKASAVYQDPIPAIDCAQYDELRTVEKYIKTNIKTIISDKAELGGTWYTTALVVDTGTHTAAVSYEDGHNTGKGTITYTYEASKVTGVSFVKAK